MAFSWDSRARRYRGQGGRFIPRRTVTDALDRARRETKSRIEKLSRDLIEGRINIPAWQIAMRDEIKALHLLNAGIARGGKAQLSPAVLGTIGADTKKQYAYLNRAD